MASDGEYDLDSGLHISAAPFHDYNDALEPFTARKATKRPLESSCEEEESDSFVTRRRMACFVGGPDLASYFLCFDVPAKSRIALCRSYAGYLASQLRANKET